MKFYYWIIIGCAAAFLLITVLLLILKSKKKHKTPKLLIDQAYIEKLVSLIGGKENINNIDVDGNKLKVNVVNLDSANLEGIKEIASSGVFVTGNNIKTLFMYDSQALKEEIKKYKEK